MKPVFDIRLAPDVTLSDEPDKGIRLCADGRASITIRPPSADLAEALFSLKTGLSVDARAELLNRPGFDAARFEYYLTSLKKRRMLEYGLREQGRELLVLVPHRQSFELNTIKAPARSTLSLSRFAYIRRTQRGLILASPEADCTLVVVDPSVWLFIHEIFGGKTQRQTNISGSYDLDCLIDLLWQCGFLENSAEQETPARASWEFHDLLFHNASRPGSVLWPVGGSFRFEHEFQSPPAIKPGFNGQRLALGVPDAATLSECSGKLFDIMENRRSFRNLSRDKPISVGQIAELLYRVARVIEVIKVPMQEEVVKVYPAGGAVHEIEFYLSVDHCDGLETGFYYYHAFDHALDRLDGADEAAAAIVKRAAEDWNQPNSPPQVVVTLASRVPRIAWKYDTVAYRATLMHAGVIVQALYLVAEDMALGCAPAGRGDPMRFAQATGLDKFEETSILEIGLGTRDEHGKATLDEIAEQFPRQRPRERG
ncbi:MAG: SagB family peptide dehydrogenase [Pseudomonadota bacterium]